MKRWITLYLSLLLLAVLTACGQTENTEQTPATDPPASEEVTEVNTKENTKDNTDMDTNPDAWPGATFVDCDLQPVSVSASTDTAYDELNRFFKEGEIFDFGACNLDRLYAPDEFNRD